jgi:uncharacterized membrane protein YsdA (DUF1294 family)
MSLAPVLLAAAYLVAINVATYAAFALDKRRAEAGQWRIKERTLLTLALLGGTIGAMTAARRLRHKTYKQPFRTYLRAIAVVQVIAVGGILALLVWRAA